jgi:hypothetical protein
MSSREIYDGMDGISIRESYGFRDPVVKNVVDKFVKRSDVGYEKYGSTLDDERRFKMKGLQKYLNDIQEELMDAVLYIQAAREELQDLSEESLIRKFVDNNGLDNAMQANGLDIDYPKYEDGYDDEEED